MTIDSGGTLTFDWGDSSDPTEQAATLRQAVHTYEAAGTYTITVTARTAGGATTGTGSTSFTAEEPTGGEDAEVA